jgi:HK97 family phage portal protein
MGFWSSLFRAPEAKAEERVWDDVSGNMFPFPGMTAESGETVNAATSMTVSAVFACIRLLSETVATLPVSTYTKRGGTRKEVKSPFWLDYPTAEPGGIGRIDLISQIMLSLLLDGNAYVAVTWNGPNIVALDVIDPSKVMTHTVIVDGKRRKVFDCWDVDQDGHEVALGWFTARDILHIPGMMLPGDFTGVSPIAYARESIGLSIAAQKYGAKFFANGAIPGAVVTVPGAMSEDGMARARDAWRMANSGADNAHRVALLTEGASFSKIAMSPDEAQFLQTRQFQVPEIARIFGVPPHLISDATNSTSWGSGLAEQNQAFAMFSLRPWLERIEAGFTRLLFAESANRQLFVKFSLDGIQRGAPNERMTMYQTGLMNGVYCIDEVRGWEDLAPLPNGQGQVFRVPIKFVDVEADYVPPVTTAGETPAHIGPDPGKGGTNDDSGAPEPNGDGGDSGD